MHPRDPFDPDLVPLARVTGEGAVSLILPTTQAPRLTHTDRSRLAMLARVAAEQLEQLERLGDPVAPATLASLRRAVAAAHDQPAEHGLALFARDDVAAALPVPSKVPERLVIGRRFSLVDVLRARQWAPPVHLLVIQGDRAVVRTGRLGTTLADAGGAFPVVQQADRGAFLRRVVAALVELTAADPLPVVVVSDTAGFARFARSAPGVHLLGVVDHPSGPAAPARIERQAAGVVRGRVHERCRRALAALAAARIRGLAHLGFDALRALDEDRAGSVLVLESADGDGEADAAVGPPPARSWPDTDDVVDAVVAGAVRRGREVLCIPAELGGAEPGVAFVPTESSLHPAFAGPAWGPARGPAGRRTAPGTTAPRPRLHLVAGGS